MGLLMIPILIGAIFFFYGKIVIKIINKIIIFSRIAVSLLAAGLINVNFPILENGGWASYLIWFAIIVSGIFLLCLFPRVNYAFKFSCTALIGYLAFLVFLNLVVDWLHIAFIPEAYLEVFARTATLALSVGALVGAIGTTKQPPIRNFVLINLERLLASVLYGVTVVLLVCKGVTNLSIEELKILLVGIVVVPFVVDIVLTALSKRYNWAEKIRVHYQKISQRASECANGLDGRMKRVSKNTLPER